VDIFISWSGDSSRATAEALREFLLSVFKGEVRPWFSPVDIGKGKLWSRELTTALERAQFGIICVTRTNRGSPWLLFEAGAIAKVINSSRVCPYLLDLKPGELSGPLSLFQLTAATRAETRLLLEQVNHQLERPLYKRTLHSAIDKHWLALSRRFSQIRRRTISPHTTPESVREALTRLIPSLNSLEDFAALLHPADRKAPVKKIKRTPRRGKR
jgi:hypothetical protein